MRRLHRLAAATALALCLGAPGAAANVPTIDSAQIAESAKTAANSAAQLNKMISLLATTQKMVTSMGETGPGAFFLGSSSWGALTGSNGATDTSILSQLPHNLCAVRGCPEGDPDGEKYRQGMITSVQEGVAFANRTFYTTEHVTNKPRWSYTKARANARRQAAISAYGVALATRSALANSQSDSERLESVINEAGTLREDVQANSAAVIALHRQMAQLQGLMATMLELQAASVIAADGAFVSVGGSHPSQAPATYVPEDYSGPGGVRMRISNADVMTGAHHSGGGSSGGLLGALGGSGNPLISGAAESAGLTGGDALGALLDVAGTVARETGNYDIAGSLGSMKNAARSGNAGDLFWSGAEAIASTSGNYQVRGVLRAAKSATRSNNPNDVGRVIDLARSAASATGHTEAAGYLSQLDRTVRAGKISPTEAVRNAASTVAQISGDRELDRYINTGADIVRDVERNATPQRKKRLYELSNDAIRTAGKRAGASDLEEVANTAESASETIPWDDPDTPVDESAQSGSSSSNAGAWDDPDTAVDESAQ